MAPFLYHAWAGASALLTPVFGRSEKRKLLEAGIGAARTGEKLGHATAPREDGTLIWFHGASVGESLSVLALISRMGVALPDAHFLLTSGTATSAKLIARRLPPRCVHQFAPLDAPGPLRRFLQHWQPEAAVFVESELWPQMLRRTHASGARMALVNARLSQKSIRSWKKRPRLARYIFEVFDLILTQNDAMAQVMEDLGAPAERVTKGFNIKALSDPLPIDEPLLKQIRGSLGTRPVWVASSTHRGEEKIVLKAHARLLKTVPDACLILAPRHPDRGTEVRDLIAAEGLSYTRRTREEAASAQVFLADTMGELGTWYALADIVFLGGSLYPIGGHNPFEVAQSGAAVLSGNHVTNFAETFSAMEAAGAARLVADAEDLARQVEELLEDSHLRESARTAAGAFVERQTGRLDDLAADLVEVLGLR
jgi:3-deoxy-D-manno-octulosonic-acid transferase